MPHGTPPSLYENIDHLLKAANVPGCAIAVVDRGGLLWADAFGFADLETGKAAEASTLYRLYSGTKLFTATAVLQLIERGLVRLEASAATYLPTGGLPPDISILHLLSHRSGLRDTLRAFLAVTFPPAEAPTTAQALAAYHLKAARRPGARVEYRNVNYALLGDVVARVSGLDYKDYVTQNILAPLHMSASFALGEATRPNAAIGYIGRWDPMRLALRALLPGVTKRLYGARAGTLIALNEFTLNSAAIGGLIGSVVDFARFLRAHLAEGSAILGAGATRKMQTMIATGAAGVESRLGVGLGWKIGRVGDRLFLNHEGGGPGFTSELRLYPESGLGIALAMNVMRVPATMRLAHRICEDVLGERSKLDRRHSEAAK